MNRIGAKEVAESLGFTTTNLKHYASLLEQNGLTIFRNTRNHREYTQHDVKILRAMQHLNREKSMPLEEAASFVMSSDTDIDAILAPKSTQNNATIDTNISVVKQESDNDLRLLSDLSSLLVEQKTMREETQVRDMEQKEFIKNVLNEVQKKFEELAITQEVQVKNFQKLLPSPEQQRLERFNMLIAERKINRELENEALNLWNNKPLNERFIKTGWFRKMEDIEKRNRFVKAYLDEHFENRMKKEYGLD